MTVTSKNIPGDNQYLINKQGLWVILLTFSCLLIYPENNMKNIRIKIISIFCSLIMFRRVTFLSF